MKKVEGTSAIASTTDVAKKKNSNAYKTFEKQKNVNKPAMAIQG